MAVLPNSVAVPFGTNRRCASGGDVGRPLRADALQMSPDAIGRNSPTHGAHARWRTRHKCSPRATEGGVTFSRACACPRHQVACSLPISAGHSRALAPSPQRIIMNRVALASCIAVLAGSLVGGSAAAAERAAAKHALPGQKIDSGLGDLPHYRLWADKSGKSPLRHRVAGEKLDSGLGDIRPFSLSRSTGMPANVDIAQRR
jgi:hypothetical protein